MHFLLLTFQCRSRPLHYLLSAEWPLSALLLQMLKVNGRRRCRWYNEYNVSRLLSQKIVTKDGRVLFFFQRTRDFETYFHICWTHRFSFLVDYFSSLLIFIARCMMCIARYCYSKSFVCPSVCNVEVPWAYRFGYFEGNCMSHPLHYLLSLIFYCRCRRLS